MCDPTLIAGAALAAGQAVSYRTQQLGAARQEDALNRGAEQTQIQMHERMTQERAQEGEKQSERVRAGMQERSRLAASSQYGNDYGRSELESFFNQSADIATLQTNAGNARKQSLLEMQGARVQTAGRVNTIQRPSALNAALQIGAAGVGAYGDSVKNNPPQLKNNPPKPKPSGPFA